MIDWCAYCQRFVSESPPYEDLTMTHAVCEDCAAGGTKSLENVEISRRIAEFIQTVGRALTTDRIPPFHEVLREARDLGIRDSDLLLGLLQPTLYEIGRLFETGDLSVDEEHRVSSFVEKVIDALDAEQPAPARKPRVLLATAPGNTHAIGARFFAKVLGEEGIAVDLMLGAAGDEILERLERGDYGHLGLSVALPSQIAAAADLARRAKARHPRLRVIAGGYPFKKAAGQAGTPGTFDAVAPFHSVRATIEEFRPSGSPGGASPARSD